LLKSPDALRQAINAFTESMFMKGPTSMKHKSQLGLATLKALFSQLAADNPLLDISLDVGEFRSRGQPKVFSHIGCGSIYERGIFHDAGHAAHKVAYANERSLETKALAQLRIGSGARIASFEESLAYAKREMLMTRRGLRKRKKAGNGD
jgi:hypothetical protein